MEDTPSAPDRTLIVLALVIAVPVILSVVAILSRDEPQPLAESTPEGVVQRYVAAAIEGDHQTAAGYLTARALESCDIFWDRTEEDIRVTLVSTETFDGSADVTVSITSTYGSGPFGVSEYATREVFDLLEVGGEWKIDRAPWQFSAVCQEVGS